MRVSYPPYLLALDLFEDIVDDDTHVVLDKGKHTVTIKLKKARPAPWPSVVRSAPAAELAARREASIEAHAAKEQQVRMANAKRDTE